MSAILAVLLLLLLLLPPFTKGNIYCTDNSTGLVEPSKNIPIVPLCDNEHGVPIYVGVLDGQPDRIFQFGGPGQEGSTFVFSTCGLEHRHDTGLSIWVLDDDDNKTLVACEDDTCIIHRYAATLSYTVPDNRTYYLRPWIYKGDDGELKFAYTAHGEGACQDSNATLVGSVCSSDTVDPGLCDRYCVEHKCHLRRRPHGHHQCTAIQEEYLNKSMGQDLPCDCATLDLVLVTDNWPNETSFELLSLTTNETLWHEEGSLQESFRKHLFGEDCLDPTHCYRFQINDNWGDGLCCHAGLGFYKIYYNGKLVASGGEFKLSANHTFGNCV